MFNSLRTSVLAAVPFTKFLYLSLQLIHSIKNMEHIKVNKDGTATFSLEMDLKNSNSKIYVLKVRLKMNCPGRKSP